MRLIRPIRPHNLEVFMKTFRWITVLSVMLILAVGFVACNNGSGTLRRTVNFDADVLVVGSGMSGLSAAMKASEAGASVVVIEKLATIGGSSATSGGGIGASGSSVQKELGIEDNVEAYWQHFLMRNKQTPEQFQFQGFPEESPTKWMLGQSPMIIDWLRGLGMTFARPYGFGLDSAERIHGMNNPPPDYPGGGGGRIISFLATRLKERGVEIRTGTEAVRLLQVVGESGSRVIGAEVRGGSKIYARAVIMATGGFKSNIGAFIDVPPTFTHIQSNDSLRNHFKGEGIMMAVHAGADLWENPWTMGFGLSEASNTHLQVPALGTFPGRDHGMLYDTAHNNRPGWESSWSSLATNFGMAAEIAGGKLYAIASDQWERPLTVVRDGKTITIENASISTQAHRNTVAKLVRSQWVHESSSLEDLAALMGADPTRFVAAVNRFNEIADAINAVHAGPNWDDRMAFANIDELDVEQGNTNFNLKPPPIPIFTNITRKIYRPIRGTKFYAIRIVPDVVGTIGGVRTETGTGRALTADREPIPGLYAVGETSNRATNGTVYMAGSGTLQALVSGYAAGEHAAGFAAADK